MMDDDACLSSKGRSTAPSVSAAVLKGIMYWNGCGKLRNQESRPKKGLSRHSRRSGRYPKNLVILGQKLKLLFFSKRWKIEDSICHYDIIVVFISASHGESSWHVVRGPTDGSKCQQLCDSTAVVSTHGALCRLLFWLLWLLCDPLDLGTQHHTWKNSEQEYVFVTLFVVSILSPATWGKNNKNIYTTH